MLQKMIEFNKKLRGKKMPDLKAGDIVKVFRKIKEGDKERVQIFEGIIIAIKGGQSSSPMITVRRVSEGIGVELILPIYSPSIEKIEIVRRAQVRRAKLYYLRGLTAKKSRLKYKELAEFIPEEELAAKEAPVENSEAEAKEAGEDKKE